jgi:hypothetical protein
VILKWKESRQLVKAIKDIRHEVRQMNDKMGSGTSTVRKKEKVSKKTKK